MEATPRPLAEKIGELLEANEMSQNALAELAGLSRGHLSKMMNGHRPWTVDKIRWLAGALDMTDKELVAGTDQETLVAEAEEAVSREEFEEAQRRYAQAQTLNQQLEAENAAREAANAALQRELARVQEERDRLISQRDAAQASAHHLSAELERGIEAYRKLRAVKDDFKTKLAAAQAQIKELNRQLVMKNETAYRNLFLGGAIGAGLRHFAGGD